MEQLEVNTNPSLQKIFERAYAIRQDLVGQRFFPALIQQIVTELGGGYPLSLQERAAVQAGILAAQSESRVVIIPEQRAS